MIGSFFVIVVLCDRKAAGKLTRERLDLSGRSSDLPPLGPVCQSC